jgi:hypothetical protein
MQYLKTRCLVWNVTATARQTNQGFSQREVYVLLTIPSNRIIHNNYLLTTNNTQQTKPTVSHIE